MKLDGDERCCGRCCHLEEGICERKGAMGGQWDAAGKAMAVAEEDDAEEL